jgi:hypothetical protein
MGTVVECPARSGDRHAVRKSAIHAGDAGGHMNVETDAGTNEGTVNTQMNALQLGRQLAAVRGVGAHHAAVLGTIPAVGHVGGPFGPDEDNYAHRRRRQRPRHGVGDLAVERAGVFEGLKVDAIDL